MIIGEVLNIGDKVVINVDEENRKWGYNPAPEGTICEVKAFGEIYWGWANNVGKAPGVYANHCWVEVVLPTGETITMSVCNPSPVNPIAYAARIVKMREDGSIDKDVFLRDLPETRFIEDDLVSSPGFTVARDFQNNQARIVSVEYHDISKKRDDGSPMRIYHISASWPAGWYTWADNEDKWELVERGKVWKYRHNEPINWRSDAEHAEFLSCIGEKIYIKNPKYNLYKWTKEEAVGALVMKWGHGITVSNGLFGSGPRTDVIKFKDEELGERIRVTTLAGFGVK